MPTLPRTSSSRGNCGHIRIITAIDHDRPAGLQLRGRFARPGAQIELADLPRPGLAVEHAGRVADPRAATAAERRRSFASLWILWQYDYEEHRWIEIIRTTSPDAGWQLHFAPVIERLLHRPRTAPEEEARQAAERAIASLQAELETLRGRAADFLLAGIETWLADQVVKRVPSGEAMRRAVGG